MTPRQAGFQGAKSDSRVSAIEVDCGRKRTASEVAEYDRGYADDRCYVTPQHFSAELVLALCATLPCGASAPSPATQRACSGQFGRREKLGVREFQQWFMRSEEHNHCFRQNFSTAFKRKIGTKSYGGRLYSVG